MVLQSTVSSLPRQWEIKVGKRVLHTICFNIRPPSQPRKLHSICWGGLRAILHRVGLKLYPAPKDLTSPFSFVLLLLRLLSRSSYPHYSSLLHFVENFLSTVCDSFPPRKPTMASVQSPQLPTIDLDEYRWKQPESQPGLWQRRACGAEAIVGVESRNKRGENDLFVSATVQLKDGKHSLKGVQQAAQRAWLVLRCQQPQIACSVAHDGQIKCLIQYRAPKDNQEAQEWAERTIVAEASERSPLDVRDAHVKSLLTSGPKSADATTIDISASVTDLDSLVGDAEISFVFHSNHIYYDGIGLREMIGAFFRGLAIALGRDNLTSPAKIDWEKSAQNLNPAYAELLRSDQQISGPSFDDALKDQLGGMMRMMVSLGSCFQFGYSVWHSHFIGPPRTPNSRPRRQRRAWTAKNDVPHFHAGAEPGNRF